ncbi:MAG TPA: DUF72 domain-containing protein [Actinomycetota bacterium]|nr:DUF72 domain-containing protein [Actinomycetota bacterium]
MTGTLYLGTSGFAYPEWKGVFYPPETKGEEMLPFYASRFRSVEVNYTFRRTPAETTLATWLERTPPGFRFTLKAHQRITHTRRLRDAEEPLGVFLERARRLGDRLGPTLFQLPPTFEHDPQALEAFLTLLPDDLRFAFEFRHPSWEAARPVLAERGVAWCVAETDEGPAGAMAWEPFGYLRLRKESYADEELVVWAERIRDALAAGRDVHCYLKHEEKGTGPRYAMKLKELIEGG